MLEKLVQEELKHGIAVEDQAMQSAAVRKRASCIENFAAFSFDEPVCPMKADMFSGK